MNVNAPTKLVGFEPLRVEFKSDPAELAQIANQWEALNQRCRDHEAPFFQSYAWNRHAMAVRSRLSGANFKPFVATVWSGTTLVGLWLLALRRSAGLLTACSLDDPFGQLAGAIFADPTDVMAGIAAVIDQLRRHADVLQIENVVAGSPLHTALRHCGATTVATQQAVFVDLRPYTSFEEFERSLKGSTRKVLRKRAERMREAYEVEEICIIDRSKMAPLLSDVFETRLQWLLRNGRTSPAFRDKDFRPFVSELADAEGLDILGIALKTKQTPIATLFGFVYGKRFYAYMSSMNPAFDKYSPGRQLYRALIKACFARGIDVLELMSPAGDDKLEWNGQVKQVDTLTLPFGVKGRLMMEFTRIILPTARRLSRGLPETLRRVLIRRLNRN